MSTAATRSARFEIVAISLAMGARHAGQGFLFPVLGLYVAEQISETLLGILFGVASLVFFVVQPAIGNAADRAGLRKVLMLAFCSAALLSLTLLVPSIGTVQLSIGVALLVVLSKATSTLIDAAAVGLANVSFGRVRLWGSAGFAGAVIIGGTLVKSPWPEACVVLFFVAYLVSAFSSYLAAGRRAPVDVPAAPAPFALGDRFRRMFADFSSFGGRFLLLVVCLSLTNLAFKSSDTFYSIGLSQLGASGFLIGLAWAAHVVPEIGFFFFSETLIRKIGKERLLLLGTLFFAIRFTILGSSDSVSLWIASQVLSSVAFCFWYVAALSIVVNTSPKALVVTGQSLYAAASSGLGELLGNIVGGLLISSAGFSAYYLFCAGCTVASLAGLLAFRQQGWESPRPPAYRSASSRA